MPTPPPPPHPQIRRLEKLPVFRALVRVPIVRSLLAGLLPGVVLRLLLLLLPAALGRLVRWAGAPSRSQVDFRTTTLVFGFQVGMRGFWSWTP